MPPSLSAYFSFGNFCAARRPHEVGRGLHDVDRRQRDQHVHRRVVGGDHHLRRRPDVHVHDGAELLARREELVPVAGVDARVAEVHRVLRERDRVAALVGDAAHFGGHLVDVPHHRDRERDEAAGIRAAPALDVPVVVGLHERGRERLVLLRGAGEQLAAELREGREAHRAEQAVRVHVLDAVVDVVATRPHVVERLRVHRVLLGRAARDRVQPDVGQLRRP